MSVADDIKKLGSGTGLSDKDRSILKQISSVGSGTGLSDRDRAALRGSVNELHAKATAIDRAHRAGRISRNPSHGPSTK